MIHVLLQTLSILLSSDLIHARDVCPKIKLTVSMLCL